MSEQYTPPKPAATADQINLPIGPLEEGDHALVEAVQKVPAGHHIASEAGALIHIEKTSSPGKARVTMDKVGGTEGEALATTVDFNPAPSGAYGINASIVEYSRHQDAGGAVSTVKSVHDDRVRVNKRTFPIKSNRARAQRIKLDVAKRIGAAVEHID